MCVFLCIGIVMHRNFQVSLDDCLAAFMSCLGDSLAYPASTMRIIAKTPPVWAEFFTVVGCRVPPPRFAATED